MVDAIKRPQPQQFPKMSFKATADIEPGQAVVISGSGVTAAGAVDDEWIGIADYDHAHVADKQLTKYVSGEVVPVLLRSVPFTVTCGTVTAGYFIKQTAAGAFVVETLGTTKTLNSSGIALESRNLTGELLMLPL